MQDTILEIKGLTKQFPGIKALNDVSFTVKKGSVHCLVGENGAGKSTLIKILSGVEKRTSGQILLEGADYRPTSARQSAQLGISTLFQELNVVEQLTVEQNLTLGAEKSRWGFLQRDPGVQTLAQVLRDLDPSIDMRQKVSTLSVGKRQILQIAKAVAANSKILIMDEPTAALSEEETKRLFAVVRLLLDKGITILFISHKLEELFAIGQYVTVLVNGQVAASTSFDQLDQNELVRLMLGKIVAEHYVPGTADRTQTALEATHIQTDLLKGVSFHVYQGEIFGFYGLMGAGKTEIARAIAGIDRYQGEFHLFGKPLQNRTPVEGHRSGVCIVPEERRTQGIVAMLPIRSNVTLTNPRKIMRGPFTSKAKARKITQDYIEKLGIACRNGEQSVQFLSGGNQQKVVFAKCLNSDFRLMLLDEPTRGVDVGAKQEIHAIARELAAQGKTIIVFSSELPEIVNLCDRIAVLYDGQIRDVFENGAELDTEQIMNHALGVELYAAT